LFTFFFPKRTDCFFPGNGTNVSNRQHFDGIIRPTQPNRVCNAFESRVSMPVPLYTEAA